MPNTSDNAATDAEAPSGAKSRLPLIAAIVVGLAVGGGSGAAVVGPIVAKKMGIGAARQDSAADSEGDAAEGDHEKESAKGAKKGEAVAPPVLVLDNLVLNPAASGGSRYLLMSIAIESADDAAVKAITVRDAELRDLILSTLGRKTVEELNDVTGREAIKAELIATIKERFGKNSIKQLYFPQFVIQ